MFINIHLLKILSLVRENDQTLAESCPELILSSSYHFKITYKFTLIQRLLYLNFYIFIFPVHFSCYGDHVTECIFYIRHLFLLQKL